MILFNDEFGLILMFVRSLMPQHYFSTVAHNCGYYTIYGHGSLLGEMWSKSIKTIWSAHFFLVRLP